MYNIYFRLSINQENEISEENFIFKLYGYLNLEFKFQYIEAKANTLYNRIQIFNHNLNNTQFISLDYFR